METITVQMEIARLRIDDRVREAQRVRRARALHSPRRPAPRATVAHDA
jgi:hypothetical protein